MKTLLIALSLLLIIRPTTAQQVNAPRQPSFYVPYAVRDVRPDAVELESSSDEVRIAEPGQRMSAPPPRPYPRHRGRYRGVQQSYVPRFQPIDSTAGAVIGAVVAGVLLAVLAGCSH